MKEIGIIEKTRYRLNDTSQSSLRKYQDLVVGNRSIPRFLYHELIVLLFGSLTGSLGYILRRFSYASLFGQFGKGAILGKDLTLRCPQSIRLGRNVALDDGCLIDARGAGKDGVVIEDDVVVGRQTLIQAKYGPVRIGKSTNIGAQCVVSASGGIRFGEHVLVGAHCYIGGGLYHSSRKDIPMIQQGVYSRGPVILEDDVWLGAGVIVLDNVRIGKGCIVGAGAVVTRDLPEYTVSVGAPARVIRHR